jgi:hypothetical protein
LSMRHQWSQRPGQGSSGALLLNLLWWEWLYCKKIARMSHLVFIILHFAFFALHILFVCAQIKTIKIKNIMVMCFYVLGSDPLGPPRCPFHPGLVAGWCTNSDTLFSTSDLPLGQCSSPATTECIMIQGPPYWVRLLPWFFIFVLFVFLFDSLVLFACWIGWGSLRRGIFVCVMF